MNEIGKIRKEIKNFFDPTRLIKDSHESFDSPNTQYRLETSSYRQNKDDVNWDVTRVKIYDNHSQKKMFDFFGNDERFFYEWLSKDNTDYLICSEDLYGGQTVIDLTNKKKELF